MKTSAKLALLTLVIFLSNFSKDRFCMAQTANDSLTYYCHSFVKIKTAQGMVIYIDPYNVNAFQDSADVVLITHEHPDHNEISRVIQKSTCQVIRAANAISGSTYNSFTIGSIIVQGFPAYNSHHSKSSCVGFVVSFNGIKLYHAGDTGIIPEMADLANLQITYALLPMSGVYTMTPEEATEAAAIIKAVYDIPIHTAIPPGTYSDAVVARFTSPNKLVVRPGSTIELVAVETDVKVTPPVPTGFRLHQNYPNPFNPSTTISFNIPTKEFISLQIFDLLGREVTTIVAEELSAGTHSILWNAVGLSAGLYFYQLRAGSNCETKKLMILK